jgi:hypothetical protein
MKIEILYFDECPNHGSTVERVKDIGREEGLAAEVVEVNVPDEATARSLSFLGSPTVRIDGVDIEPSARLSKHFGLMCRRRRAGGSAASGPDPNSFAGSRKWATRKRERISVGASVFAAIGASLCCILPILAGVTGAGAIAAGVAFEKWRAYLLGLTGLLLAGGVLFAWRDHKKAYPTRGSDVPYML